MVRRGASNDEIAAFAFNASQNFVNAHRRDITAAPTETLAQIADAHAAIAQALERESPTACAEFGFSGLKPNTARQLSSEAIAEFGQAGRLMIIAAHEGAERSIQRSAELSDQDANAFADAVQAEGLSNRQTEMLFAGKADEANLIDRCKMTVALYGGVADLPAEQSARVIAVLLQSV
jgi:hypothetical protein